MFYENQSRNFTNRVSDGVSFPNSERRQLKWIRLNVLGKKGSPQEWRKKFTAQHWPLGVLQQIQVPSLVILSCMQQYRTKILLLGNSYYVWIDTINILQRSAGHSFTTVSTGYGQIIGHIGSLLCFLMETDVKISVNAAAGENHGPITVSSKLNIVLRWNKGFGHWMNDRGKNDAPGNIDVICWVESSFCVDM